MLPGPHPNRALVATFASIAIGCGVLVLIAGVILATDSWPATTEVAGALGGQQACDTRFGWEA
jgi:hypothetical protein